MHTPDFNPLEFEGVKTEAGANAFTMSPQKWIKATNAIGIVSKSGRKEKLVIPELTPAQKSFVYADEADLLNVALFGQTAKKWHKDNPGKKGNIRDYTDLHHLLVLAYKST